MIKRYVRFAIAVDVHRDRGVLRIRRSRCHGVPVFGVAFLGQRHRSAALRLPVAARNRSKALARSVVVGASSPSDTTSPQFWVDRERLIAEALGERAEP